jgi:hypothetical protein
MTSSGHSEEAGIKNYHDCNSNTDNDKDFTFRKHGRSYVLDPKMTLKVGTEKSLSARCLIYRPKCRIPGLNRNTKTQWPSQKDLQILPEVSRSF